MRYACPNCKRQFFKWSSCDFHLRSVCASTATELECRINGSVVPWVDVVKGYTGEAVFGPNECIDRAYNNMWAYTFFYVQIPIAQEPPRKLLLTFRRSKLGFRRDSSFIPFDTGDELYIMSQVYKKLPSSVKVSSLNPHSLRCSCAL